MRAGETNEDATALALAALGWTVSDVARAHRLLDMTGLTPTDLRARAGEPSVLSAVLGFLEAYEPDLIACAEAIGAQPAALVAARARLEIA
ncbi:DUF3572 family protein [Sphingomonas koreensis]|jgi:hypothetical protein|uniref:DUF3572 family protein n=1 Tax=Sphingomonas koreensis TaxID=93064 RepID=A0A2M8WEN6_9SPHN|nr:DUF3572 family protein [Sphingomonas koreensis]PJI89372.1 uncharacterized protein DUF3572 [Sphingomonas koreensis]RSU59209.1 DUF3572 family protein [Sphingomonas koreensis]RSU68249.1 DUF3572 family protein [Sphingomonas koreensis]RSY79090.1 DUF3572 family protein [Sphingomonas koreensis]